MAPNEKEVEAWNGGGSMHYIDHTDRNDRQLAPFTEALLVRGLVGLAGKDAHDEVVESVRSSLAERYEPGVGLQLGAAARKVTASV